MAAPNSSAASSRGREAELRARAFLEAQGLRFVAANYRCRLGELDLVMQQEQTLIVVEVKARSRSGFGGALASITLAKQEKIIAATLHFLQHHPQFAEAAIRFDVVTLEGSRFAAMHWLPAAFTA